MLYLSSYIRNLFAVTKKASSEPLTLLRNRLCGLSLLRTKFKSMPNQHFM